MSELSILWKKAEFCAEIADEALHHGASKEQ
jgi:hypothetical protein